ncbi:MAG TPA: hypothetical protein VKV06_05480, partial [Acidimicrobiales bacterium]|nr:hypothetical protein [Acidimicrobiales bacterium]
MRPGVHLARVVTQPAVHLGQEPLLFGLVKVFEVGRGAAEGDLAAAGVDPGHQGQGHQAAEAEPVLRFDDEVGDLAPDRVDDHLRDLPAGPVGARHRRTDRVPRDVSHWSLLSPCGPTYAGAVTTD